MSYPVCPYSDYLSVWRFLKAGKVYFSEETNLYKRIHRDAISSQQESNVNYSKRIVIGLSQTLSLSGYTYYLNGENFLMKLMIFCLLPVKTMISVCGIITSKRRSK